MKNYKIYQSIKLITLKGDFVYTKANADKGMY